MGNSQSQDLIDLRQKLQGLYLYGNTYRKSATPINEKQKKAFLDNFIKNEKQQKGPDHNLVMLKYNVVKDKLNLPLIKTNPITNISSRITNNQERLLHLQNRNKFQNLYLYKDTYKPGGTPVDEKYRAAFLKEFYDVEQNYNDLEHDLIMLKYNVMVDRLNTTKMKDKYDIEILNDRIKTNQRRITNYER